MASLHNPSDSNWGDADLNGHDVAKSSKHPQSRLPAIWSHFSSQLDKIDDLEKRIRDQMTRSRRRVCSVLDQTPPTRHSHLRLFVTHKHEPMNKAWTLVVEGKLLIGLLDHAGAQQVDRSGPFSRGDEVTRHTQVPESSSQPSLMPPSNSAGPSPTSAPRPDVDYSRTSDRNQYRTVGDKEEDPVDPTLFTHIFEKMTVSFQTIWQPDKDLVSTAQLTPPKKSRKRKVDAVHAPPPVNPKHLKSSETSNIVWTKKQSADAHAFHVHYKNAEAPPSMEFHSVVAKITFHPSRPETLYSVSPQLAEKLFPKHMPTAQQGGSKEGSVGGDAGAQTIPLENTIQVPNLLTMNEVVLAFFQYITDKGLQDPSDRSMILFDPTLSTLFEQETLHFGDLQTTLLARKLISPVGPEDEPVVLTYTMNETSSSPQEPPHSGDSTTGSVETHHPPLSFDMDVSIPSFFHYRARELLRRIKRREFEYTSSRTKARYMLVASRGNEDMVKTRIGETISGNGFSPENIPVFLALAKAAPPNSEARVAAQVDARTCAMVGRLDECTRQAKTAQDLVDSCRELAAPKVSTKVHAESDRETST